MTDMASALYAGFVKHRRLRPRPHALRYRIFQFLLDLDEIPELDRRLRLFSVGHFNLFSFRPHDYGDGSDRTLRSQVDSMLRDAGIETGGAIHLLTMPRILGYAFNPLSVFFCYRRDQGLAAILYEVNNTFGQRHSYLMAVDRRQNGLIRQACAKEFYVSPFLDMSLRYRFDVRPPAQDLAVSITVSDSAGTLLKAVQTGARLELTDAVLMRAFLGNPLLTVKVICGIHWEALRLWLKGVRLVPRPPAPAKSVTVAANPRPTDFPVETV